MTLPLGVTTRIRKIPLFELRAIQNIASNSRFINKISGSKMMIFNDVKSLYATESVCAGILPKTGTPYAKGLCSGASVQRNETLGWPRC